MRSSRTISQGLLVACLLVLFGVTARAGDPGIAFPAASELSDQKAGSVLFYVFYNSSTTSPNQTNTKFSLTNTSATSAAFVHLFFVAAGCSVADRFMCLTANQTASFNAFDEDPGIQGYLIVVAADGVTGCPRSFNFLIGDEFIRNGGTHQANLGAEAFAALYNGIHPACAPPDSTVPQNNLGAQVIPGLVTLAFDGIQYNRGGRVLAIASVPSFLDGNDTRVIVVRVGGDLVSGPRNIGTIFGLLFNDAEDGFSWSIPAGCQVFSRLTNDFPRVVPRFTAIIPSNQTGWTKFWPLAPVAVIGAVLNYNPNAGTSPGGFTGGHTLHKLTLQNDTATMPIFPPSC
jgi:hypothetical protein